MIEINIQPDFMGIQVEATRLLPFMGNLYHVHIYPIQILKQIPKRKEAFSRHAFNLLFEVVVALRTDADTYFSL